MTSSTPDGTPADTPGPMPDPLPETPRRDANLSSAPKLSLTQFLDLDTLQEVQDSFTAVTGLNTTIRDRDGKQVTADTDAQQRRASDQMLD